MVLKEGFFYNDMYIPKNSVLIKSNGLYKIYFPSSTLPNVYVEPKIINYFL